MASAHAREPGPRWQVQEAKQRFSEVLRKAHEDGPQIITRHGEEVAIIIDMAEYRHSGGETMSLHDYLLSGPAFPEDFDQFVTRGTDDGRDVSFLFEE